MMDEHYLYKYYVKNQGDLSNKIRFNSVYGTYPGINHELEWANFKEPVAAEPEVSPMMRNFERWKRNEL